MGKTALWELDAIEQARLIRAGAVSSVEAVKSALARLDEVNPSINAVVLSLEDEALAAAAEADALVRAGGPLGLLHGVPVTTKVNTDQRGLPNDNGVVAFRGNIAHRDSPVVANLRRAGAVIFGRTNAPAFSMRWFTDGDLHGRVVSPWSAELTPGGSSGGAAAAVATGIGAIAHGNDIAGSIRFPAFCCGVYGLRPSYGRVPAYNHSSTAPVPIGSQLLAVHGPLARRASDLRLAFEAMGRSATDDPRTIDVAAKTIANRRVAICTNPGGGVTHPAIAEAVGCVGRWLESAGYVVETREPPHFEETAGLWPAIAMPDVIAQLEPLIAEHADAGARKAVGLWRANWPQRDPAICLEALGRRFQLLQIWGEFFDRYVALVMPACRMLPFPWDADTQDQAMTLEIIEAQKPLLAVSALGLPAVAAPTGLHNGVPIGVQIVSGRNRDEVCLDLAGVIEAHAPQLTPI